MTTRCCARNGVKASSAAKRKDSFGAERRASVQAGSKPAQK